MTPPPHDAFWTRVAHSGLVDAETLAALRHAHDATVPATDLGSVPAIAQWLVRRGTLTRWQARRLAADEPGPFFLGDYRLLDRRDRRGDGLLFKARHDPSGRDVNLMLLNAKLCRNVEVWTEIVRRTTAAHQATHPFLMRTWALEQVAGSRFIVCEAVPGRPLAEELERLGPLPPREAATVVARACRAVAALHAAGVVHGAISLDTLIRTTAPRDAAERTGRIRLLQYPLVGDPHAVALRPAIGTDEEVAALGSRAAFVAPELLLPDQQCDQRSDVYGLGCLLHALLVGRAPGWHGDPQATLKKAAFSGLEPIGPEAGVPEEIATLVSYMTTRDPEARYQTAADAAEAIAACCGLTADDEADPEPDPGPPVGATAAQDDPRAGEARDFPVAAGAATGPAADPAADQAWPTGLDVGAATAARAGSAGTKRPTARMRRLQFAALAVPALILLVGAAIVGPQLLGPGADRGTQVARTEKPPRTRPTGDPDSRTPPSAPDRRRSRRASVGVTHGGPAADARLPASRCAARPARPPGGDRRRGRGPAVPQIARPDRRRGRGRGRNALRHAVGGDRVAAGRLAGRRRCRRTAGGLRDPARSRPQSARRRRGPHGRLGEDGAADHRRPGGVQGTATLLLDPRGGCGADARRGTGAGPAVDHRRVAGEP